MDRLLSNDERLRPDKLPMVGVIASLAGAALAAVVLRDVFHQIFHPQGSGGLSGLVARGLWRAFRAAGRSSPALFELAGPIIVVAVIASWVLLMAAGWALLYWSRLPMDFRFASSLTPLSERHFSDAMYFSLTSLTTVGYGDITPVTTPMRLAAVAEAALGFGLLTAGITWVLSLYPVLQRRRAAAAQVAMYCDMAPEDPAVDDAAIAVSARLIDVAVDALHFPTAYYFHDARTEESLPVALVRLESLLNRRSAEGAGKGVALAAAALDTLRERLCQHPALVRSHPSSGDVVRAYAADHLVA